MLDIEIIPVSEFQQNCRVLSAPGNERAVVVDPGGNAERVESYLQSRQLQCSQIWLTHSHLDHCGGVAALFEKWQCPLYGHIVEKEFRARVEDIKALYGIQSKDMTNCPEPTVYLTGGESVEFAGVEFSVLFTPGHSPGHLCFYAPTESILLAGDTVFAGSIGRTDLPGGDSKTLFRSIVENILTLPDDTKIMSGHGPDTVVGTERRTNPFFAGCST